MDPFSANAGEWPLGMDKNHIRFENKPEHLTFEFEADDENAGSVMAYVSTTVELETSLELIYNYAFEVFVNDTLQPVMVRGRIIVEPKRTGAGKTELLFGQPQGGTIVIEGKGLCAADQVGNCSIDSDLGISVTAEASPDPEYGFAGWSGDCQFEGSNNPITVSVGEGERKSCFANFRRNSRVVIVPTVGGRVSGPEGVNCAQGNQGTENCRVDGLEGTGVTFIPEPDEGFRLSQWNTTCSGSILPDFSYRLVLSEPCSISPVFEEDSGQPLNPVSYELSFEEGEELAPFTEYQITITSTYGAEVEYRWYLGDPANIESSQLDNNGNLYTGVTQTVPEQISVEIWIDGEVRGRHTWNISVAVSPHNPMNVEQSQFQVNAGTPVTFNAKMFDFENIQMNPNPLPVTMLHEVQTLEWILIDEDTKSTRVLDTITIPMEINPDNITDPNALNQHNILTTFSYTPDAANTNGYWVHTKATLTDGTFILGSAFLTVN